MRRRLLPLALLALALAACGKKGDIVPPDGAGDAYVRNIYPNPATVVSGDAPVQPAPATRSEEFGGDDREFTTTFSSE